MDVYTLVAHKGSFVQSCSLALALGIHIVYNTYMYVYIDEASQSPGLFPMLYSTCLSISPRCDLFISGDQEVNLAVINFKVIYRTNTRAVSYIARRFCARTTRRIYSIYICIQGLCGSGKSQQLVFVRVASRIYIYIYRGLESNSPLYRANIFALCRKKPSPRAIAIARVYRRIVNLKVRL